MSGEEAWIRAFAASVIELEAPAAVKADVQGFLAGHGVPAEALVALPEAAAERLAIYRTMVHGRLRGAVERQTQVVENLSRRVVSESYLAAQLAVALSLVVSRCSPVTRSMTKK